MRRPVKFRIAFYIVAALCFYLGSGLLPDTLPELSNNATSLLQEPAWRNTLAVSAVYFLLIPLLYYFWVIRAGGQAGWKILIVLSLSSLVARFTYPQSLVHYFEFISWLKYPVIGILLLVEIYLMVTIIRAIWGARKLSGDPRLHMLAKYRQTGDETLDVKAQKERELALMLAHEPASWYYAVPRFSQQHSEALANVNLLSGKVWHLGVLLTALVAATAAAYLALISWSETAALIVATLVFYFIIVLVANYRVSRHYSVYGWNNHIVINNSWWGLTVVALDNIAELELGHWPQSTITESFHFGRGDANIRLTFVKPQSYFAGMAMFNEHMDSLYLTLDNPHQVLEYVKQLQHSDRLLPDVANAEC